MKSILFDESLLEHPDQIARQLFQEEEDPRSPAYKRVLIRPVIHWGVILRNGLAFLLLSGLVCCLLHRAGIGILPAALLTLCAAAAVLLCRARAILICCIRIYQRYAPDALRNKCRFEPSCSQYMIQALEKYGLWKGLGKGWARLRRCKPPYGGWDLP